MESQQIMEMDLSLIVVYFVFLCCALLVMVIAMVYITATVPDFSKHESEKYYIDPNQDNKRVPFASLEDSPTVDLSVIVPAYNEEERLLPMMDEALEHLEKRQKIKPFKYEIIIVDDGSKDKTTKVGIEYSKKVGTEKVKVLTLARNRGKGGAIRMGVLSARGRRILFADADGASKFSDVDKLEEAMSKIDRREDGFAIVCGSRAHLEEESIVKRSFFRTILMLGFHMLVHVVGSIKGVKDTQCGFKLMTRNAASVLFHNLHVERWAFDVDLLYIAQHFKMPIAEVAVTWHEIPGSKLDPVQSSLQMGKDLFLIRLRYTLGAWKIEDKSKSS